MEYKITYSEIKREIRQAAKHIRNANKGLPWPVKINKDFSIIPNGKGFTLQINYTDGEIKDQVYNIAF